MGFGINTWKEQGGSQFNPVKYVWTSVKRSFVYLVNKKTNKQDVYRSHVLLCVEPGYGVGVSVSVGMGSSVSVAVLSAGGSSGGASAAGDVVAEAVHAPPGELPRSLKAITSKLYVVPASNPSTIHEEDEAGRVATVEPLLKT
jgi:hypothetical protein